MTPRLPRRHLIRLWLRDPEYAWKTPEVLQPRWDRIFDGVTPENSVFPPEPYLRTGSNSVNGRAASSFASY